MDQTSSSERSNARLSHRSHTSLPKITTSSDKNASSTSKRHNPLHRDKQSGHSHHHHHHHHHHRHRQAKELIHSTAQSHSSVGDSAKQNHVVNAYSPALSTDRENDSRAATSNAEVDERIERQQLIRPIHVSQERKRAAVREEEIRVTLHTLSEKSLEITRRLDDTYYSILERLTTLGSTISGLQELSSLTQELKSNFQKDTQAFKTEIQGQIDSFEDFGGLQERVEGIVSRIQSVKDRCSSLSDRLEQASKRVEAREMLEIRRQENADKRARVIKWVAASTTPFIVLLAMLYFLFFIEPSNPQSSLHTPSANLSFNVEELAIPVDAKQILNSARESLYARNASTSVHSHTAAASKDARLGVLDEL
ncbi:hypothetical protein EJ05DRAFT_512285 [Pseudovirgaria hyperparasitica]|uniref:Uncharacterized protein n=1 Tax=Pseudovirgaria hyperparasitica TaxID=470096 RepID=A0A6A6W3V9_9PEZI|nr:uncharacterized protein EJ05DRAFT_512285 [Pseudovirgaria hyperparasitica]KAF2756656.1 hypothetical protein EJ05DRAFT_512285 [Pseudovirgaria hyperparasitica]